MIQIPHTRDLSSWMASGVASGKSGLVHRIMMTLKFWSNNMIRRVLRRNMDRHLVPSDFMKPILVQRGIDLEKISVLGHFGRIE